MFKIRSPWLGIPVVDYGSPRTSPTRSEHNASTSLIVIEFWFSKIATAMDKPIREMFFVTMFRCSPALKSGWEVSG